MKRRDFLKKATITAAAMGIKPWELPAMIARLQDCDPNHDCKINVAHVEKVQRTHLEQLYFDHARACQEVHQSAANNAAGTNVPVELWHVDPLLIGPEEEEKMASLDVFSVSSLLTRNGPNPSSTAFEDRIPYIKRFWWKSDAVGVFAAGNEGETKWTKPYETPDTFSDATSLTVGEAGRKGKNWYVKAHSENTGHVSLVCTNPLDERNQYVNYINPSPSLKEEGIYALIEDWLLRKEAQKRASETEGYAELDEAAKAVAEKQQLHTLREDIGYRIGLPPKIQEYLANPQPLHDQVFSSLRDKLLQKKGVRLDRGGKVTGLEGTSYSAPAVAGAITAAKYLGKLRQCADADNTPLCSQELVALALLSTQPVDKVMQQKKGSKKSRSMKLSDLSSSANARGLHSSFRAGFGLFDADMFKDNVAEAYKILDKAKAVPSVPQYSESDTFLQDPENKKHFSINVPRQEAGDTTIIRLRLEYESDAFPPTAITLVSPQGTRYSLNMAQGNQSAPHTNIMGISLKPHCSWGASDRFFGEKAAGKWTLELDEDIDVSNLRLTLHGVREGGLVDAMIERKLEKDKERTRSLNSERGR